MESSQRRSVLTWCKLSFVCEEKSITIFQLTKLYAKQADRNWTHHSAWNPFFMVGTDQKINVIRMTIQRSNRLIVAHREKPNRVDYL